MFIFQHMCDRCRLECTLPFSYYTRHVSMGAQSVYSYFAKNADYEKTSLSDGKEEVRDPWDYLTDYTIRYDIITK